MLLLLIHLWLNLQNIFINSFVKLILKELFCLFWFFRPIWPIWSIWIVLLRLNFGLSWWWLLWLICFSVGSRSCSIWFPERVIQTRKSIWNFDIWKYTWFWRGNHRSFRGRSWEYTNVFRSLIYIGWFCRALIILFLTGFGGDLYLHKGLNGHCFCSHFQ